jgi:hypothetical protein
MARAQFSCPTGASVELLRQRVDEFAGSLGESSRSVLLDRQVIGSGETKVRHFGFKRWRLYNIEGSMNVYQTRLPDSEFIYLSAFPTEVVAGIELF